MSQVTIYLEEDALNAAKEAARRADLSLSKWFAQFAEAEMRKPKTTWEEFFAELDRANASSPAGADGWDALLVDRYADLGTDTPREAF
ncbi:hypothetical protein [Variovorax sp. KK3]|uniref:hypothetical protein n=1 Tax=Variovorax sp. KK3 TaxID=1855728 RepID=UPI001C4E06BC|nr:hypothetical protein [Variovorax sp. KK3]